MRLRSAPLAALVLLAACAGDPPPAPTVPVPSVDALASTWPVQTALDRTLDEGLVAASAARWLGGAGRWKPPGAGTSGSRPGQATLAARQRSEDSAALRAIADVLLGASCRLAQEPGSYDADLSLGFFSGAQACEAVGDAVGATRAHENLALLSGALTHTPNGEVSGVAVTRVEIEREGTTLRYSFFEPGALEARVSQVAGDPPPADPGPTPTMADSYARRVGTADWSDVPVPDLPGLPSAPPSGLAAAEALADIPAAAWKAALTAWPEQGEAALEPSSKVLLEGWARKAVQRDLGLVVLSAGDPGVAMVLLEEAAGSRSRPRPEPGLDPLLLASLAKARFQANELRRTVDLLEDIGAEPGWELAREAARAVARVAVLPSAAEAKVNR